MYKCIEFKIDNISSNFEEGKENVFGILYLNLDSFKNKLDYLIEKMNKMYEHTYIVIEENNNLNKSKLHELKDKISKYTKVQLIEESSIKYIKGYAIYFNLKNFPREYLYNEFYIDSEKEEQNYNEDFIVNKCNLVVNDSTKLEIGNKELFQVIPSTFNTITLCREHLENQKYLYQVNKLKSWGLSVMEIKELLLFYSRKDSDDLYSEVTIDSAKEFLSTPDWNLNLVEFDLPTKKYVQSCMSNLFLYLLELKYLTGSKFKLFIEELLTQNNFLELKISSSGCKKETSNKFIEMMNTEFNKPIMDNVYWNILYAIRHYLDIYSRPYPLNNMKAVEGYLETFKSNIEKL